jgi:hypothetical protein
MTIGTGKILPVGAWYGRLVPEGANRAKSIRAGADNPRERWRRKRFTTPQIGAGHEHERRLTALANTELKSHQMLDAVLSTVLRAEVARPGLDVICEAGRRIAEIRNAACQQGN